jgi:hypothetical protein
MTRARPRRTRGAIGFLPFLIGFSALAAILAARLPAPPGQVLWNLDLPKIDVPLAVFFHEALQRGQLPLWEPKLGLGFPLYAEGQIGAFYPPNWLIFQLEPLTALDASRVLHLTIAGVGTGLLALRVSGSRPGALVAASVAVLGGAIVSKLEWTNLVAAYAWLPWILLLLARRPAPRRLEIVGAGALWGWQALAGHPNTWLLTGIAAGLLILANGRSVRSLGHVLVFGVVGAAVGSIQLLPTFVLTGLSVRSTGLSADDVFTSAATVFDPLGFGFARPFLGADQNGWDIFTVWYPDGIFALYEAAAFVGLVVLGLAAIGAGTRRARAWLVVGAVLLAIPIVAMARPDVWLHIPILNAMRSPVRAYVVVAVVLGVLASIGVGRLGRIAPERAARRALVVAGFVAAFYALVFVAARWLPNVFDATWSASVSHPTPEAAAVARERAIDALSQPIPLVIELACAVAAYVLIVRMRDRLPPAPARFAIAALAIVPLAVLSPPANPFRAAEDAWPRNGVLAQALRTFDPNRVLTIGDPGFYEGAPDRLAAAGIPDLAMFSSLNLSATDKLLADARGDGPDAEKIRTLVGVDTLVTFGDTPCPGTSPVPVEAYKATVCRVPALTRPYWLSASSLATDAGGNLSVDLAGAIEAAEAVDTHEDGPGSLTVTVDAPAAGYVWIDRAWWPAWDIEVDGHPTKASAVLAGMAVPVEAGRHVITVDLVPSEALGGLVAALVVLAIALLWALSPLARRRS